MTGWEVWRQDDNGNRVLVGAYPTRVPALARIMVLEAGHPHKQLYELIGDRRPTLLTNRDLYLCLVAQADGLTERALLDYLCALWSVSRPLASLSVLDGDLLAAMLLAAATATPVRPEPVWRVADFTTASSYVGFADFTKVLCTQITDLLAFEEQGPLQPLASFGVDAPTRLDGGRATVPRWCNFDPPSFLECAAAGAFGGWSEADGRRVRTHDHASDPDPAADAPRPGEQVIPLDPITWGDAATFLEYGQSYE